MALGVQRIASRRGIVAGAVIIAAGASALPASAAVYNGNGNTGFGGPLGTGSLTVTDTPAGVINFTFNAGASNNDYLVIYIDSVAGGFASTAGMNDNADANRTAISGSNGTTQSVVNFASGFTGDYAIATPGAGTNSNFAGLWGLATGGGNSLPFVASANIGGTQNATTFSINASDIGLTPNSGQSFNFVATYISGTAYRSNEAIGNIGTVASNPGGPPSAITFSDFRTYTLVPEPASLGLLAGGAMLLAGRRRR